MNIEEDAGLGKKDGKKGKPLYKSRFDCFAVVYNDILMKGKWRKVIFLYNDSLDAGFLFYSYATRLTAYRALLPNKNSCFGIRSKCFSDFIVKF